MILGEPYNMNNSEFKVKSTLFTTTFSKNGYFVYGRKWIESFLDNTETLPHITAKIYIDGMTPNEISDIEVPGKIEVVDYESNIPEQQLWKDMFEEQSKHIRHVKKLSVKFSYKSFVIIKSLRENANNYVVWLDADCIFKSPELDTFTRDILQGKFIACQKEAESDHVESGILIFDTAHPDKQRFLDMFNDCYHVDVNSFGELYDGFAVNRTLINGDFDYINLNEKFGLSGVQSDPNLTFLHPDINKRFHHNIGITGKRNYEDWRTYSRQDRYFQMIHGIDPLEIRASLQENVKRVNDVVNQIARRRNVR